MQNRGPISGQCAISGYAVMMMQNVGLLVVNRQDATDSKDK